jgi:polysaccharide biosynthesis protein PslH
MNLLIVSPNLPRPSSGASTRNYYLLRALARKHKVSLVALVDRVELEQTSNISQLESFSQIVQVIVRSKPRPKRLQQLADLVRGKSYILNSHTSQEVQDAIEQLFAHNHYDVVHFESVLMAGYLFPEDVKIVIDQHNIEHELLLRTFQRERAWLRKWYNWLENRLLKPVEIRRCLRADVVLVTSERERLALKDMLPEKVIEVVPNGVDIEYFHGNQAKQEVPGRIVFTGAMDYYPNVDAVLFFARHCWPLIRDYFPNATWQIVGRNPLPEVWKLAELPDVTVTGSVSDVRPYLAAAEVAIAPLLIAGGTRLKILEALAMRKAVVSTSAGCEGLSVASGEHLMVEDQPKKFALAVIKLLSSSEARTSLGAAGRRLVEAEYSWERCGDMLLHALEKLS